MNKETLIFLGKDSGFGEKNNSAYFEDEKSLTIIDCGFTVFQELKKKFDFDNYQNINVIITHLHNDHAGSLSQLILYLWFTFNKKTNIYSKCKNIKEYLDITGTPSDAYTLKDDSSNIKFIKTEHVKYLDSYGFSMNIKDRKIVYTGDTCTIDPFLPYLEDADEFYVDVSKFGGAHLKIDDIIRKLQELKESGININFMHMDDKKYINEVADKFLNK